MAGKHITAGFTLPELVISLGILGLLFSIVTISLFRSQRSAAQGAQTDTIFVDIQDQQTKAMSGSSDGTSTVYNYGVYFDSDSYTLFRGSVYDANEPTNFRIQLDASLAFANVTLPSSTLVFEAGSGEVVGFTEGSNTFAIEDRTNGGQTVVTANKYGVLLE